MDKLQFNKSTGFWRHPLILPLTLSDQQENGAHILKNFLDKLLKMDNLQFNKSTGFWRHPLLLTLTLTDQQENDAHIFKKFEVIFDLCFGIGSLGQ